MSSRKKKLSKKRFFKRSFIETKRNISKDFLEDFRIIKYASLSKDHDRTSKSYKSIFRINNPSPEIFKNIFFSPATAILDNRNYYPSINSLSPNSRELVSPFSINSNKNIKLSVLPLIKPTMSIFPSLKTHQLKNKRIKKLNSAY